ncbi:lipase family protein [Isosphaeraceae bacterium EP7]
MTVTIGPPMPSIAPAPTPPGGRVTAREGLFGRPAPVVPMGRFRAGSLGAGRFEWETALSLALASKLAYDGEAVVRSTAISTWGLRDCRFIESDDTQCFVAWSDDVALVSFRGTESLGDWLGNLNALSTTRGYGTVHRGFLGAFQVVDAQLRAVLSGLSGRPVLLTGHSLGGALASVAAAEWQGQFPISWIYTYGQPAVGKGDFPTFIEGHYAGKYFRFVNDDDVVPRVPPTFHHVGRLIHFDASGGLENRFESAATALANEAIGPVAPSPEAPPMMTEEEFDRMRARLLEERARARIAGTEAMEAPQLEGFLPSVSDHSIDQYLAKVAAKV